MVREFAPAGRPIGRDLGADPLDDPLTLQDLQIGIGDCGRDRVTRVGEAVEELTALPDQHLGDTVRDHQGTEGLVTRGDGLGEGHEVGAGPEVLAAEPLAGAPEAADDLVRREEDAVAVDDALDLGPVGARRDDDAAGALHRFGDEGRDFIGADLEDLGLEFTRRLQTELVGIEVSAALEPIGLGDVDDAGDGQAALRVHRLHATEGSTGHGAAVVAVPAADDHLPLRLAAQFPVAARHPQHRVVRFAAGAGEERMLELGRRKPRQTVRQLDGGRVRALEEAVVVRQLLHLTVGGLGEFAATIAERHAPKPRHPVEDAIALGVVQVHPLGVGDDPRTARCQRLVVGERMQVVRGVQGLPLGGGVRDGHDIPVRRGVRRSAAGAPAPRN